MPNSLKELRLKKQILAKEMVAVVRTIYPKYDMTSQSKCENSEAYGMRLMPDAMNALYKAFDPDGSVKRKSRSSDRHRLKSKVHGRITDAEALELQKRIAADGYDTVQDWLSVVVRDYLSNEKHE